MRDFCDTEIHLFRLGKKNPGWMAGAYFFDYVKMIHNAVTVCKIFFRLFNILASLQRLGFGHAILKSSLNLSMVGYENH